MSRKNFVVEAVVFCCYSCKLHHLCNPCEQLTGRKLYCDAGRWHNRPRFKLLQHGHWGIPIPNAAPGSALWFLDTTSAFYSTRLGYAR